MAHQTPSEQRQEGNAHRCRLGVAFGRESLLYSFPDNPMNKSRLLLFEDRLRRMTESEGPGSIELFEPLSCTESDLETFHTKRYVEHVKRISDTGEGILGSEDTPGFKGVFEAAIVPVGNTMNGLTQIMEQKVDHFFNPVGGLHHAWSDLARGFCVFNDVVITISKALGEYGLKKIAYVDIDAHHGDEVYYAFESDPRVIIGDIHEDGRFLYPGTGGEDETGIGPGLGTKLNFGLSPGSGDSPFIQAFDRVEKFVRAAKPEMIFYQCGADGLRGDPITTLSYSPESHAYATKKLHRLAHELCQGRLIAMGGGGYNPMSVSDAWGAVIEELTGG